MFDAAVIGGGLAGCNAAITLAQKKRRVLLLEAAEYPHPKVCGEFLSPECTALFAESGFLPELQKLKPVSIQTVCVTAPDGSVWRSKLPAPALGISRYALDEALARYAVEQGVTLHSGTRVTEISGSLATNFCLTTRSQAGIKTFEAKTVIAAYGKRSTLDRVLNRSFLHRPQPYIGLKRHFIGSPLPNHIDLHVFPGGYCGMSEIENGQTNVCLLVRQDVFQKATHGAPAPVERFIQWMCAQNPHLAAWLSGAIPVDPAWLSIGQVPFMNKSSLEGDVLMAGDAAGMIAPLAGDGMAMALHSGRLAARAVEHYLAHEVSAEAMKQNYARSWDRTFHSRIRLGRLLQSVMLRPALLTPGLHILNRFPALGHFIVAQTRNLHLVER